MMRRNREARRSTRTRARLRLRRGVSCALVRRPRTRRASPRTEFENMPEQRDEPAAAKRAGGDEVRQMAGGVEALRLMHATLTTLRFAVMLAVFLRATGSWRVSLLGLVAIMSLDLSNLAVFRPQTFAQVWFALLLLP